MSCYYKKWKTKIPDFVRIVQSSIVKGVERGKIDTHNTNIRRPAHFPGLVQALQ
jgi:hypothetical protein